MDAIKSFEVNPIIVKELRSRMRGGRAFATLTITLVLLGILGYALYRMTLTTSQYSSSPISPQIGQMLFTGLAFLLLLIIAAITPSITAGEISGEREKQTYEMLLATPLSPASILWGKLIAAMSYIFLVIFAAIPMASLVFIYGGVSIRDMVKALAALLVVAIMFGVIGLFYSALFNHSGRATVLSYLTVALLLFGPLFAAVMVGVMNQSDPPRWIMAPSPIMVLASTFSASVNPSEHPKCVLDVGKPGLLDPRFSAYQHDQHPTSGLPFWVADLQFADAGTLPGYDQTGKTGSTLAHIATRSSFNAGFDIRLSQHYRIGLSRDNQPL